MWRWLSTTAEHKTCLEIKITQRNNTTTPCQHLPNGQGTLPYKASSCPIARIPAAVNLSCAWQSNPLHGAAETDFVHSDLSDPGECSIHVPASGLYPGLVQPWSAVSECDPPCATLLLVGVADLLPNRHQACLLGILTYLTLQRSQHIGKNGIIS